MNLNRTAGHIRALFFACLLFMPSVASATTEFFVDAARVSSGDGSAANPWKDRWDINWTTVAAALSRDSVTIYFSSRATWTTAAWTNIPAGTNGSATRRLTLDGQSKYNTAASGGALWQTETNTSNLATFATAMGQSGGPITVRDNSSFITIRGFRLINPAYGGINLGETNPTFNIHDIVVENNVIDTPQNNHGIWFGFAENGCYNVIIRNNAIVKTPLEGIYIGHFSYLADTITGVVVEHNTLIDTGTVGEGDIDIKPGAFGAIVRYNTHYDTGIGGVSGGVVVFASDVQIYGNQLYNLGAHTDGFGIHINTYGSVGEGKSLANILIYNNLVYGNATRGIMAYAQAATGAITGLKILNNTVVSNAGVGLGLSAAGDGRTITVSELHNNIFSQNGSYEIDTTTGVTISAANNNLVWRSGGGNLIRYQNVEKDWASWQALGFDAAGVNANPQLDGSYMPSAGSPVIDRGIVRGEFTTDKASTLRQAPWDIGAYEYNGASNPVGSSPPSNLRLVP